MISPPVAEEPNYLVQSPPSIARTPVLPLWFTQGIAVTAYDYAYGATWGGHLIAGRSCDGISKFLPWKDLDDLSRSRPGKPTNRISMETARWIKMEHWKEGRKLKEITAGSPECSSLLTVSRVCCGLSYWWCGWDFNDFSRASLVEDLLCSTPYYRSGSLQQALQFISATRSSKNGGPPKSR